jgi:hypothetical protein
MLPLTVNCPRCGRLCKAEESNATSARPFRKAKKGLCTDCAVTAFFKDDNGEKGVGFALACAHDFKPEYLLLPHIQQQFNKILAMGQSELKPEDINWQNVIDNWNLPL